MREQGVIMYEGNILSILLCLFLTFLLSFNLYAASQQVNDTQTIQAPNRAYQALTPITLKQLLSSPSILKNLEIINKKNQLTPHIGPLLALKIEDLGIPVGENLILSLYIKESAFSDLYVAELFALKSQRNAKLSLMSLFDVLDFPINVDANNKSVTGWFLKENNTFELQFPLQESDPIKVVINGVHSTLAKDNYQILGDDIFVEADIVAQWFDLDFDFNYSDLKVKVITKNPLPIQLSLARKNRKKASRYNNTAVFPWKKTGYQAFSSPLLDLQLNSSINKDQLFGGYSLLSVQDMAYLTSELYINGNNNDSLTNARLTFSKEDENEGLLGPLHASRYQFGDITAVKMANSSTGGERRGFRFSNQKSGLSTDNKTTTISGNIQAGWDAELYRNGLFVEQQINIQDGRYDFRDIVLFFGENKFDVILYGPQGQVQQVSSAFYIDSNMLKKKQSAYDFSISQVNKSLLGISNLSANQLEGWETTGIFSKGITDNFSLNIGGSSFFNKNGDDLYQYSLGASLTPLKQLLISADFQQDNKENESVSISGRTILAKQSLSLSYTHNRNKIESGNTNSVQNYDFIMSGGLFPNSLLPINYENEWAHSISDMGTDSKTLSNQVAFRTRFFSASNRIYWTKNAVDNYNSEMLFGSFELQRSFSGLYTRLLTGYQFSPDTRFTQIQSDFLYPLTNKVSSSLVINHTIENEKYSAKLGLNWSLDSLLLNSTASYNSDHNWSIGLFTSFGFGYEPVTNQFFMAKGSLARSGAVVARVFEDANLNGVFDDGEHLLEGVKVKALQGHRQEKTNKDGIATLTKLSSGRRTDIIIDPKTLEDPFVIPATPGVSITPRKGFIEVLDIPMVNAGELEGTVYLIDKIGNESLGAYLDINLHNSESKLVATTETEFDGYYLFTNLVPGSYTVSIDADDIKRKNLHDVNALEFDFSAAGDVIAGADFVVDKYTFVKGYVVDLGGFNSLEMLKIYWQLIKASYANGLQQQVFYREVQNEQKFHLNAAFFKREAQAERACNYLQEKKISCSVKQFEFNI